MEPLVHFAIPFTIASLLGLRVRWSFLAGLVGVIPDFDALFFMHRSISHSILPVLPLLISLIIFRRSRFRYLLQLTCLGWSSHAFLDFIGGFTSILWPLLDKSYKLIFEATVHIDSSSTASLTVRILERAYDYGVFKTFDAPLFTAEGLAVSLTFIALSFAIRYRRISIQAQKEESI